MTISKLSASRFTIIAIVVITIFQVSVIKNQDRLSPKPRWETQNVINWDVREYYLYLPATFIYHDPYFNFLDTLKDGPLRAHFWMGKSPYGRYLERFSMGMAVAYSPFFFLSDLYATMTGAVRDGFSAPYQFGVFISGLFYGFFGLVFLGLVLRRFFSDGVTAITLACIGLGTNFFYYTTTEGAMSHAALFFLCAVFLYYTIRWHQDTRLVHLLVLTFAFGLAVWIRPTTILIGIIFLFYGITNKESFRQKSGIVAAHPWQIPAAILLLFLIALPQMLYWKHQAGSYIFYSYPREHFFFNHPQILKGLFSYRKGWLVYTPIMILALAGILLLKKYAGNFLIAIPLFLVFNIYVVFSWWCWWYGGSFGLRAFIESYVFLAIPMACLWTWVFKKGWPVAIPLFLIAGFFTYLNLYQSRQYREGMLHYDSMDKKMYWATFMKYKYVKDADKIIDPPNYDAAMLGLPEDTPKKASQSQ